MGVEDTIRAVYAAFNTADVFDIKKDGRVHRLQVYPADPAAMAYFWR